VPEDTFNSHGTRGNKNIVSPFQTADLPSKTSCNLKDMYFFGSICCSLLQGMIHVLSILLKKTAGFCKMIKQSTKIHIDITKYIQI